MRVLWRTVLGVALCLGVGESCRRLAVVPEAVPVPAALPALEPFRDIDFGQRWYDGVQYGYRRGIIYGMTETHFGAQLPATRAMAAAMVWRMAGQPEAPGQSGFQDVEPGRYYTAAVAWGEAQGLWEGYGDGTFRPDEAVTWPQLELVLGRYCGEGSVGAAVLSRPPDPGQEERAEELTRGELAEALMKLCEEKR